MEQIFNDPHTIHLMNTQSMQTLIHSLTFIDKYDMEILDHLFTKLFYISIHLYT